MGVVIPAFNSARWIPDALRSLQRQRHATWTAVVIDDGSGDETAALADEVAKDDRRIQVLRQGNAGVAAARNRGIAALPPCSYLSFLDSDDRLLPEAFTILVSALEQRPDAVGAYGLADYIDASGRVWEPGLHPTRQRRRREVRGHHLSLQRADADATFRSFAVEGPIWPSAVGLHRAHVVQALGGFDPSFQLIEDWELYLRASRQGPYVAVDTQVAEYRRHETNLTGRHDRAMYYVEQLRRAAWQSPDNTPEQRQEIVRAWRLVQARHAAVLGLHVVRSVSRRQWRPAGRALVGAAIAAGLSTRPGPPSPARWRGPWLYPTNTGSEPGWQSPQE